MGKTSTACKNKYNAKAYDQIKLVVKKGERDRYKRLAEQLGVSVNQLFLQAVEEFIAEHIADPED